MAVATTLTPKGNNKGIHQALRPRRCSPSDFQPSLENPSRVTTSSMINAASAGVPM
jgi:hypothetical protein